MTGDGVLDSGALGMGPFGAGFCGGIESRLTTLRGPFEIVGLITLRRGEPDPTEASSAISDAPVVVAKELVPETAERGTVPSVESLESRARSLNQDP